MERDILVAVLGVMAGVATGYAASRFRRQETREAALKTFDIDVTKAVRGDRVEAYRALWKVIEPLSREWDGPPELRPIQIDLRRWYYHEGGIFLTAESQSTFWDLQRLLGKGDHDGAYSVSHQLRSATRKEIWSENAPPSTEEVG